MKRLLAGGGGGGGGDPDFANVVLLMHNDGSNGSTSFIDSSNSGHVLTANGNAQISTAESVFGGASALFDGTGDFVSAPASADFEFGSGRFSIEFWLRLVGPNNFSVFYTEDGRTSLHFDASRWVWRANNTNVFITNDNPTLNTWHFVQVVNDGTTTRLYRNNSPIATGASVACVNTNSAIRIGTGYQSLNGYLDDLRITKGVARAFSLPTEAFPNS